MLSMATAFSLCATYVFISFVHSSGAVTTIPDWPLITPGPKLVLQPRTQDLALWGYVSGNSNSPLSCPSGFTATFDGAADNFVACCNGVTCTNDYHTCNDYLGTACPEPGICSEIYTQYLQCAAATPSCILYARITGPEDGNSKSSFACGQTGGTVLVLPSVTGASTATDASKSSTSHPLTDDFLSSYSNLFPISTSKTSHAEESKSITSIETSSTSPTPTHSKSGGMDASTKATIAGVIIAGVTVPLMILGIFAAIIPVQTLKCLTCGKRPKSKTTSTGELRPPTNPELRPAIVNAGLTRINNAFHTQPEPQRYTMNYYPQPQPQYQPQYQPLYPQHQYR
ncbi:hypothetical protein L228DRAFT_47146 [Xylona heveae TC161]|uniref:Mid2 domain-containing protein n=1 Tax=Xylona heveae (strain CBS 132557 / TC161) TaxID=1328760 RepID=A0A164ZJ09_XYLHT|nr:hypothetical protein L228DRAFT_47146 [Xylona heveae TC161]KZF19157.1 hypothetical protein L228DRAFT_47146 [Xylona heveae TC161]